MSPQNMSIEGPSNHAKINKSLKNSGNTTTKLFVSHRLLSDQCSSRIILDIRSPCHPDNNIIDLICPRLIIWFSKGTMVRVKPVILCRNITIISYPAGLPLTQADLPRLTPLY